MKRITFMLWAATVVFLMNMLTLLAQTTNVDLGTNAPPGANAGATVTSLIVGWQNLVIAVAVPLVLAGLKKWMNPDSTELSPTIKKFLVVMAPVLGAIGAAAAGFFGVPVDAAHIASGAVFGGATGIGLREIVDQLLLKLFNPSAQNSKT